MAAPKVISSVAEFQTLLAENALVVADFHAVWCGPCKAIAPMYAKFAADYTIPSQLAFAKIDVDEVSDLAAQYGVTAMPTFLFFKDGKPYPGRHMIRGADPSGLRTVVVQLAQEAGKAKKAKEEAELKKGEAGEKKEDTPTVSGGYTMGTESGARSDWKMSLKG